MGPMAWGEGGDAGGGAGKFSREKMALGALPALGSAGESRSRSRWPSFGVRRGRGGGRLRHTTVEMAALGPIS
jgi:hypothetical protein